MIKPKRRNRSRSVIEIIDKTWRILGLVNPREVHIAEPGSTVLWCRIPLQNEAAVARRENYDVLSTEDMVSHYVEFEWFELRLANRGGRLPSRWYLRAGDSGVSPNVWRSIGFIQLDAQQQD